MKFYFCIILPFFEIIIYTMKILDKLVNLITYKETKGYNFYLPENINQVASERNEAKEKAAEKVENVFSSLSSNLEYVKKVYNFDINSDIKIREFCMNIKGKQYKAFLLYIEGMIDSQSINKFVIEPLMLKSSSNLDPNSPDIVTIAPQNNVSVRRVKRFDLAEYILNSLVPQNDVATENSFESIFPKVNAGVSALFVDTLNTVFTIDAKGFEKRSIASPENEVVIRGSQEGFIEAIRTNTSLLRRIINNEDFVIEETNVRKNQ